MTNEIESEIAMAIVALFRRLGGATTRADHSAALDGARRMLRMGLCAADLAAFWETALLNFFPSVPPNVAFLVRPDALAEVNVDYSGPARVARATGRLPSPSLNPRFLAAVRAQLVGVAVPWTSGAVMMVQRTAEALEAGGDPYVPSQLVELVTLGRRTVQKSSIRR